MHYLVFALCLTCAVNSAVAVVCDGAAAKTYLGKCVSHPLAYPCNDGSNCQCVAAVFKLCNLANTRTWKKGTKVMGNCASIPMYTAIATFRDGVHYEGHAAIFLRCSSAGIVVYDQWCGQPLHSRTIRSDGSSFVNNANNYYVINR